MKKLDEEYTAIGFRITPEMKRNLKIEAAKQGKTIKEILEELVKEYLSKFEVVNDKP